LSKFTVRPMSSMDLDAVSIIYALANPHASSEAIKKWTTDTLEKFSGLCYVAEVEGRVVSGVSGLRRDPDIGVVDDLAVAEEYQGRGIGSALLGRLLGDFKNAGLKVVMLEVHHLCSDAIPFYHKHGFRISGLVQDCFGVGHDAIIMRKELNL